MADAALSATESALENQRIGALQIRVVAICSLIQICYGYDVGSIGWAVPSLTHAWNLPPSAFALAFLWSKSGLSARIFGMSAEVKAEIRGLSRRASGGRTQ